MPTWVRTTFLWFWAFLAPLVALAQTDVRTPKAPNQGGLAVMALIITLAAVLLWMFAVRYRDRVHP